MGADLLISVLAYPADKKLNWAAGDELIDATTDPSVLNEWLDALDLCGKEIELDDDLEPVHPTQVKDTIKKIFEALKEEVVAPDGYPPRDVTDIRVRDLWVVISGGMSWGDLPTDACGIMDAASNFPDILEAIGFDLAWDTPA